VDRFADDTHFKGGAHLSANLYWATQILGRAAMPPDAAVVGEPWREIWLDRLGQLPALMIAGWTDGYRNTQWDARRAG